MSYRIMQNRKNKTVTLHFTANATVVIAGDENTSNIALPGEVITGAHIRQAWYGTPSGAVAYWRVSRGANTVAVLDSTSYTDFAGNGNAITLDQDATLTASLVGSPEGYLIVELQKIGEFTSEYFAG